VYALRRRLAWIVCGWLCCQLSILTAAPLSLLSGMPHAADSVTCTCAHAGATECPMHHSKPKKDGCECRSTTDPDAGAVLSLLGPIAVLSDPPARAPNPSITQLPNHPITKFTSRLAPPSSPPPRA
jgi:hypothetical protein